MAALFPQERTYWRAYFELMNERRSKDDEPTAHVAPEQAERYFDSWAQNFDSRSH